ncbi:MAG: protein translocase subunit SecF [bacterium]|nr:protein translocase subunit SecF [bacterium]
MNIIKYRKIFLSISGILVLASIIAIAVFGFQPGIDFSGGTLWQIAITRTNADSTQTNAEEIKKFFETDLGVKNVIVFPGENQSFLIRFGHISEEQHQNYLSALKNKFGEVEELRFEGIGPTIGKELKRKAVWAIIMVMLGISLYIAFAFRKVSYPIKSWKYGIITLITLFHDVIIPAGLLAVLGRRLGIEIDTNFVVALLVVMGFSIHDTIVVFDRIRENLLLQKNRLDLPAIINNSVNQTFVRSINTSLTLILVLLALFFFGPVTLKYFILTILIGTTVGTYSSIFVASTLLLFRSSSK